MMMNSDTSITPTVWLQNGQFHHHAPHDIFFHSAGSGPESIFLIHGFPTASWDWVKLWPVLSKRFRVVAPDLLGFGFSAKPPQHTHSFHEQADTISFPTIGHYPQTEAPELVLEHFLAFILPPERP